VDRLGGTARVEDRLDLLVPEVIGERLFGTAGQLYVEAGGTVLVDGGWGDCGGTPVDAASVHPAFCVTKPVLALAVGHAVDRGRLGLDDRVTDRAPVVGVDPTVTVRQVLAHRAGLREPSAAAWWFTPPEQRPALLPTDPPSPRSVYSEMRAWQVLDEVLQAVGAGPAQEAAVGGVLEPIGVDGILLDPARALAALERGQVRVPVGGLPLRVVPLLAELLPARVGQASPVFSGLVSMSGLGRLYSAVKTVLRGRPVVGLPTPETLRDMVRPLGPPEWDPVLRRACGFAGGFMVGLGDHRISDRASPGAVGHTAGLANSVAFCDPERDLAVALYLNGSALVPDDIETMRLSLLDRIVRLVDDR
jgi:CubicO group peptidase (beta-lactamase class C family)